MTEDGAVFFLLAGEGVVWMEMNDISSTGAGGPLEMVM